MGVQKSGPAPKYLHLYHLGSPSTSMRMVALWKRNRSPKLHTCSENLLRCGSTGSTIGPKSCVAAPTAAHISYKRENCNGKASPCASLSHRRSPRSSSTLGRFYPPRTPLICYHSAKNSPCRMGPITRSPPTSGPCWNPTGTPSRIGLYPWR